MHAHDGRTFTLVGRGRYASGGNGIRRPEGWAVRPHQGGGKLKARPGGLRARVMGVDNFSHYTPAK